MNMGQRSMQLEHSYVVNNDGSVKYIVNPMPNNPNLLTPGPAMLFVTINGIPSVGKWLSVGVAMSQAGAVPLNVQNLIGTPLQQLPAPVTNNRFADALPTSSDSWALGKIIGVAVGAGVGLLLIALIAFICVRRRRKAKLNPKPKNGYSYAGRQQWTGHDGVEYKQYDNPALAAVAPFSRPRGSMGTFDSFKMGDVTNSAGESREALGAYFDRTPGSQQRTPLATPHMVGSPRAQQGWGEHRAGDAGEYYNGSEATSHSQSQSYASEHSAGRYYDYPAGAAPPGAAPQHYYSPTTAQPPAGAQAHAPQGGAYGQAQ